MPVYIPPRGLGGGSGPISGGPYVSAINDETVFGTKTWEDDQVFVSDVNINGDLRVDGRYVGQVEIEDYLITLNSGQMGSGISSGEAGIEIDRGTENYARLMFKENTPGDNADNRWYLENGDGFMNEIVYNLSPDDYTFNGKITVNNDLELEYNLIFPNMPNSGILVTDTSGSVVDTGIDPYNLITDSQLQSISGSLQDQIDNISISGSGFIPLEGEGITITPSGSDYIFAVTDYISASEVYDIRDDLNYDIGLLELEIADVSGSLQGQIDNIDVGVTDINGIDGSVTIIGGEGVELTQSFSDITLSISDEYVTTQDISGFASKNDLDDYVLKSGDGMTGQLSITVPEGDTALQINDGEFHIDDVKFSSVTMSNVDVNTIIDEFPITVGNSCFLDLLITNGTDFRASRVISVWNNDGTFIKFNEISSESIGDTSDIDINVSIYNSTDIRIKAQPSSGTWNIKMIKKII